MAADKKVMECDLDNIPDSLIDDLPPALVRKLLRRMKAQRVSERDKEESDKDEEDSEKERKKLVDLHKEKKGSPPDMPVEEDDLPEGMYSADESDDDSSVVDSGDSKVGKGSRKA